MSHYTKRYEGMTEAEKHDAAIQDIIDYVGPEKFDENTKLFKEHGVMRFDQFEFYCSLAGVQYYPVRAWFKHCYGVEAPK